MPLKENTANFIKDLIKSDIKAYLEFREKVYGPFLDIKHDEIYCEGSSAPESPSAIKSNTDKKENGISKDALSDMNDLQDLEKTVSGCKNCRLHKTRTNTVFGEGSDKRKLVIIGEAPGAEEDRTGRPFVGRAGQLLTKMLEAIAVNRDPLPDEITSCSVYLDKQLDILKPSYILALGRISAMRLLDQKKTMKEFRQDLWEYRGIPVLVTYHPSALLRNPQWKYPAWDDLRKLKELLDK